MSKIKGIYAASMSIFNSDLSLNIEKTVNHAEKIIDQGCHGVAIFGSTGQAQLISIIFSAWLTVFSMFKLKSLLNTDIDAA